MLATCLITLKLSHIYIVHIGVVDVQAANTARIVCAYGRDVGIRWEWEALNKYFIVRVWKSIDGDNGDIGRGSVRSPSISHPWGGAAMEVTTTSTH